MGQGRFDSFVDAKDEVVAVEFSAYHWQLRGPLTSVAHLRIVGAASSASAQLNAEPLILVPN